jgi:hypothetical protein
VSNLGNPGFVSNPGIPGFWYTNLGNPGIVSNLMKPKSAKNPPPFLYGYKVFIAENIESDGVFNEI